MDEFTFYLLSSWPDTIMSTEVTVINDMDLALNKLSLRGMKRRKEN